MAKTGIISASQLTDRSTRQVFSFLQRTLSAFRFLGLDRDEAYKSLAYERNPFPMMHPSIP